MFANTSIDFTTTGKRHLGATLGNKTFKDENVKEEVVEWCKEITKLLGLFFSNIYIMSDVFVGYATQ